jgi:hypothetical protein
MPLFSILSQFPLTWNSIFAFLFFTSCALLVNTANTNKTPTILFFHPYFF